MNEREKNLRKNRADAWAAMQEVSDKYDSGEAMVVADKTRFESAKRDYDSAGVELDRLGINPAERRASADDVEEASLRSTGIARSPRSEIQGQPNEVLTRGQSVREWFNRAQANGVTVTLNESGGAPYQRKLSDEGRDRDLNRYWGEKFGFCRESAESRGLLEDTAGSAQAITPQAWVSDYIDVLLPNTILGRVGARTVPMPQETVTVPVFTSTVSPSWIAEAGSISLDANPAFAPLQLFAPGGFKDITQFSVEAAQDAFIRGNLDGMLAEAVAKKMQVVLDTSMLLGISGNTGVPGINGETGFVKRHYTADAGTSGKAPTDTTELGVVAELTMKTNATPNAFVSNVGCQQAFERLPLSTYGKYWDLPPIVEKMDWVTSENSALPYLETDPATASSVAQTGGSYTSLYSGPWDEFCVVGLHLDLQTRVLTERYIDSGNYALFSFCRYSIRFAHPETFTRTIGVIPV